MVITRILGSAAYVAAGAATAAWLVLRVKKAPPPALAPQSPHPLSFVHHQHEAV